MHLLSQQHSFICFYATNIIVLEFNYIMLMSWIQNADFFLEFNIFFTTHEQLHYASFDQVI